MNMNQIQLAQWRDIAIEYLPAAQQFREKVKARPTEDRESQSYAMGLWDIANKTMERHEATVAELTAAMVLQALSELEMYDPANLPALNKLNRARNPAQNDMSDKDMRCYLMQGILNVIQTLKNVTGCAILLDDPLVYFVDPAIAAMPAMEQIELQLDDVVRISEAAPLMGCTVESLLRQAANDERLLYVALKPHFQTLSAIPSHPNPKQGARTTKGIMFVAMMSRDAVSLATIGSAEISQYQASFGGALDWHYWMLDVPQTVGVDMVFVPRSQLPANTTAANVATLPDTSPSGDDVEEQAPAADDDGYDETLAALFDPVPVDVLETMFPTDGNWKSWAERAARNGLIVARVGTAMFNPYKAGMWFVTNGGKGLTIGRCRRMLANNHLPDRSMDCKNLLTGELD